MLRPLIIFLFALSLHAAEKPSPFRFGDINSPDFFPILPWDPQHTWNKPHPQFTNEFASIAECHFNMAGFVLPQDLARCKQIGLSAIMLPTDTNFTAFEYFRQWPKLSDAEIDRRVRDMVHAAGKNPAVAGYFITDEPNVNEFSALGKAVAAVKKYAPGKLAYINLFPDYATLGAPDDSQLGSTNYTDYLERFVAEVKPQCLSYDNYLVQYSNDLLNHAQAAGYFRNLLEIRRVAQKHNLPYLNIVSSNQIRPGYPPPSPANLLLQAYTTLAAGYRGVTWYTYYSRGYQYGPIGNNDERTITWTYLENVNRQIATLAPILARLHSTGVYFTQPSYATNLPALPGNLVTSIHTDHPIMVGEFADTSGAPYVMFVNLSVERSTKLIPKFKEASAKLKIISAVDAQPQPLDLARQELWLAPGQGILLNLH